MHDERKFTTEINIYNIRHQHVMTHYDAGSVAIVVITIAFQTGISDIIAYIIYFKFLDFVDVFIIINIKYTRVVLRWLFFVLNLNV